MPLRRTSRRGPRARRAHSIIDGGPGLRLGAAGVHQVRGARHGEDQTAAPATWKHGPERRVESLNVPSLPFAIR